MTLSRFPTTHRIHLVERNRLWKTRSDAAIEEEIWDFICKDRSLGHKYTGNIVVEVESGRVRLQGHILEQWHSALLVNIANRVEGVIRVENEVIADSALRDQVIQALIQDEKTSPYIFTVKSRFGWVSLGGLVSSQEIAKSAEGVAGAVSAVRGILSLPTVFGAALITGEDDEPVRRTLQPRLAAAVYQDGGVWKPEQVGLVSEVLIDPCSRLVSAIGVKVTPQGYDKVDIIDRLVPITSIEAVNDSGVWLKEGEVINQYPIYERWRFPLPPSNWRPPFPYLPGTVRWSLK